MASNPNIKLRFKSTEFVEKDSDRPKGSFSPRTRLSYSKVLLHSFSKLLFFQGELERLIIQEENEEKRRDPGVLDFFINNFDSDMHSENFKMSKLCQFEYDLIDIVNQNKNRILAILTAQHMNSCSKTLFQNEKKQSTEDKVKRMIESEVLKCRKSSPIRQYNNPFFREKINSERELKFIVSKHKNIVVNFILENLEQVFFSSNLKKLVGFKEYHNAQKLVEKHNKMSKEIFGKLTKAQYQIIRKKTNFLY